ncbi:hypothetical protein PG984_014958 [Apiospora sp. TS-2023a]
MTTGFLPLLGDYVVGAVCRWRLSFAGVRKALRDSLLISQETYDAATEADWAREYAAISVDIAAAAAAHDPVALDSANQRLAEAATAAGDHEIAGRAAAAIRMAAPPHAPTATPEAPVALTTIAAEPAAAVVIQTTPLPPPQSPSPSPSPPTPTTDAAPSSSSTTTTTTPTPAPAPNTPAAATLARAAVPGGDLELAKQALQMFGLIDWTLGWTRQLADWLMLWGHSVLEATAAAAAELAAVPLAATRITVTNASQHQPSYFHPRRRAEDGDEKQAKISADRAVEIAVLAAALPMTPRLRQQLLRRPRQACQCVTIQRRDANVEAVHDKSPGLCAS